jgi:glycosyltransferase involved in cell wall biosynthesis
MNQLITILIRTSNRPALFARCIESVKNCGYMPRHVIVSYDNPGALNYIPAGTQTIQVTPHIQYPYYYDLYCNTLKLAVTDGWFLFLDDDDQLLPGALEKLAPHLTEPGAIICQFIRNGIPKPRDNYIRHKVIQEGKIGLPCLVLHHKYNRIGFLDGWEAGDYRYIKEVTDQVPTKFIALPLVTTDRRSLGEMEAKA